MDTDHGVQQESGRACMLTVALPVWNSADIAWLAMESLCNQDKSDGFSWELLVCEEHQPRQLGAEFFFSYLPRLQERGCTKLGYLSPDEWIPLPMKWRMLGQSMDASSGAFMLQAADCYSFSQRINVTHRCIVDQKMDWYDVSRGHFYSLLSDKVVLFSPPAAARTHLNMAISGLHARNLPVSKLLRKIDGWMFEYCRRASSTFSKQTDNNDYGGVDTHGLNNISKSRETFFQNPQPPFLPSTKKLEDLGLPESVSARLRKQARILAQ